MTIIWHAIVCCVTLTSLKARGVSMVGEAEAAMAEA